MARRMPKPATVIDAADATARIEPRPLDAMAAQQGVRFAVVTRALCGRKTS